MATQLQIRRGTSTQVAAFTGAVGELVVNTTNDSVHVNDGSTAGGFELARVDGSNWAITNAISTTANISFGDNDKAIFGAGSDLQIYHDGSNSYVDDAGTGNLLVRADNLRLQRGDSSQNYFLANTGAEVAIYYAGAKKLETTSTGITVSGAVGAPSSENFYRIKFQDQGGIANDVGIGQPDADSLAFNFTPTAGGHIAFFAGSSEKVRIDSSGRVGIGTGGDTPTALLEVEAASNPEISIASSGGATSNFLNFKAISHSQQIQTQLKTVDNGDFTSDLAFLFKASGTSGALGEKARLTADGNLLVGTSSDTNTGKVRIQGATSSGGDSTVLTLHQGNFANGGASLIKIGTEAGNFAKSAIGFKRTDDYDRGAIIFCQENTGDQSDVDSSDEVMRIDASGNIGIGATSMSHPLVIENPTPIIELIDSNLSTRRATIGGENGNVTIDVDPNQAEGTSFFSVDVDNTERFRIDSSGNATVKAAGELRIRDDGTFIKEDQGLQIGNTSGTGTTRPIRFFTESAERMRVDSSGQLLIGCTGQTGDAPNSDGFLFQQIGNLKIRVNSDGQACQQYYSPTGGTSSPVGSITVGASSTAFNTSSDQRLKENIADADDAGSRVDAIQVRQFDWIADGSHQDYGMVAQELQSVAPEAVTGDADSDEMMAVDYSKLVPMLVKEIQSLRARVQQLENG